MIFLENFSQYEPNLELVQKYYDIINNNYKVLTDQDKSFVIVDEKPRYLTGFLRNKGNLVNLIFNELQFDELLSQEKIHEPSLRKAIKNWIDDKSEILESVETTFDVDFAIAKIQEHFPFQKVKEMLDKEILEWTPEDRESSFYSENSNGEAEDAIITYLIDWYASKYPSSYSEENDNTLRKTIQTRYNFLNY